MTVQGLAVGDFQKLNALKAEAKLDAQKALPEVAKQFEGIFLQTMLKSMRMGAHFLDESSPFSGKNQETFQEMLDGQYASSIAENKGVGLSTLLAKQLQTQLPASTQKVPEASLHATALGQTINSNVSKAADKQASATMSIDDFVKSIWPMAKQAASLIGLDPKILMAQAALETGWGKFMAKDAQGGSSNNVFNIKATATDAVDSVEVNTTEYIADTPIKMQASFKKYPTLAASFSDYVALIKGHERYQEALSHAGNPEDYVHALHKAGYATDPQYESKILSIYHGDELHQAMARCGLTGA